MILSLKDIILNDYCLKDIILNDHGLKYEF